MNRREASSQRGFALLVVLFAVALLGLLTARMMAEGRGALAVARDLRDATVAEAAAEGAVQQAIFQVRRGAWRADGNTRVLRIGRATIAVAVLDEGTKINPSRAGVALLTVLLRNVGAHAALANALAGALVDWRTATPFSILGGRKLERYRLAGLPYGPAGKPFASVDELAQVPGMTPPLLARVRSFLSVYQPAADGDEMGPAERIAGTMDRPPPNAPGASERVIKVQAVAALPDGATARRVALVHLGASLGMSRNWQILTWGDGQR